ncbi:hypothetical protein [Polaribacter sp. M15]
MKPYIYSILFLIIIQSTYAQTKKTILKKSYKVDKSTVFNLDLDNVAIVFEESFDDKIHFEYTIEFIKYPRRKMENLLGEVNAKVRNKNNRIYLDVKNSKYVGENRSYHYTMDSLKSAIKDYAKEFKNNRNKYKTKDSIINEIRFSTGNEITDFMLKNKDKYEDKSYVNSKKQSIRHFVIKVPSYVKIEVKAIHSKLFFNYNVTRPIKVNAFQGKFKFKKLLSKDNIFELYNGFFQAEEVYGGIYKFKDVYPTKIGVISNSELNIESTKVKIGEVGENIIINDLEGDFYFYNFSNNFSNFSFQGDFSKLNLYKVKDSNYAMNVFGLKTTLNMNNTKTTFGTSEKNKFTKILEKKPKAKSLNKIEIKLTNGILNIH